MIKKFDYLIVGAGFAGLSTAYHLVKANAGSICLVEQEGEVAKAASGRNAAMICQIVSDPVLSEVMLQSTEIIQREWREVLPRAIAYNRCGSLHIGMEKDLNSLGKSFVIARNIYGLPLERWSFNDTVRRYPQLKQSVFEQALFCASDGVIDIHAMAEGLFAYIQERGVVFKRSVSAKIVQLEKDCYQFKDAEGKKIEATVVINAAGAWAGLVGEQVGAQSFPVNPFRRHIFVSEEKPMGKDPKNWPIVWDMTEGAYMRPDGSHLQLSPCDEEPYLPGPTDVSPDAKSLLDKKLKKVFPKMEGFKLSRSWSGLRTFSEDRRFVIGWDSKIDNFFGVACLGGYGMTASAGVGKIASDLLLQRKVSKKFKKAFSPYRFLQVKEPSSLEPVLS